MTIRQAGPDDIAGQRDPFLDLGWPASEAAAYFTEFLRSLENTVFLAETDIGPTGYLAARWVRPGTMRTVATAELERAGLA